MSTTTGNALQAAAEQQSAPYAWPDGSHWSTKLDCGHVPTAPTTFHSNGRPLTTGSATLVDHGTMCYSCADSHQAAVVADPDTHVFHAYVSSDGRNVTTWTGGVLARVIQHGSSPYGCFGRSPLHYWTAVDVDGKVWRGRNGGPGMAVTMRRG